ncbi:MAG TPA: hypothetical protein DCY89_00555, partial [Gammaproteobacteria bacterium]|nr:hypothetical protein [Gammaproteobacteria bacterium]
AGRPPGELPEPPGLIAVRIDPDTGLRAPTGSRNAITEYFPAGRAPAADTPGLPAAETAGAGTGAPLEQQLF